MDPQPDQPCSAASRGFSGALARGLALLLVAAVAAHASAGEFASLSRTISRGVGTEATSVRAWSIAFARAVRRLAESDQSQPGARAHGPSIDNREGALPACRPESRALPVCDGMVLTRLDLPPPARG
ncbi:MAG: hypothetical protein FJ255_09140 [Phycisphaerae bacterium]|nr:hypothetical protein [Phycisphaerae bacterium]